MNVYAVRLIPQLKIKFCELLGIGTSVAMNQLGDRLHRLERSMDRFENQMRRIHRRQLVLEAQVGPQEVAFPKKKRITKRKVAKDKAPVNKTKISKEPVLKEVPSRRANVTEIKKVTGSLTARSLPFETKDVPSDPKVLVIRGEAETLEALRSYFGEEVSLRNLETFQELESMEGGEEILALFFDRTLLGQAGVRQSLEEWSHRFPKARVVGISSYLTLTLAQSLPGGEDFASFLTKPLTSESLAGLFEEREAQAIS